MESLRPLIPIPTKAGIAKTRGNPVSGSAWPPFVVAGPVASVPSVEGWGVGVGVTPAGNVTVAPGSVGVGVPWMFKERLLSLMPVVV